MRPNLVGSAAFGFVVAGIEYEYVIDYAVIVEVVVREIDAQVVVGKLACLSYHFFSPAVNAVFVILSIVFGVM